MRCPTSFEGVVVTVSFSFDGSAMADSGIDTVPKALFLPTVMSPAYSCPPATLLPLASVTVYFVVASRSVSRYALYISTSTLSVSSLV